jgi:hypothetical protein
MNTRQFSIKKLIKNTKLIKERLEIKQNPTQLIFVFYYTKKN